MTYDPGKEVDIAYNYLNLPMVLTKEESTDKIFYHYDAIGNKVAQSVESENSATEKLTEYYGNFIYTNGNLSCILTDEGRIVPVGDNTTSSASKYRYEYNLKDHLGNTRAVFAGTSFGTDLIQTTSYYPFGLVMVHKNFTADIDNYAKNNYLYNGKEMQNEGFGGVGLGWLDYGARMYDPAVSGFGQIDPMSESYYSFSPYSYCAGNPIIHIDVDGEWIGTVIGLVVGGTSSIIQQKISGAEKINWKSVGIASVQGAIIGTFPAAVGAAGVFSTALGTGAVGFVGDLADQKIAQGKDWDDLNYKKAGVNGLISGISVGVASKVNLQMRSNAVYGGGNIRPSMGTPLTKVSRPYLGQLFYYYPGAVGVTISSLTDISFASGRGIVNRRKQNKGDKPRGIWIEPKENPGYDDPTNTNTVRGDAPLLPEIKVYPGSVGPMFKNVKQYAQ